MLYPVISLPRCHSVPSGSKIGLRVIRSASSPTPHWYLSFSYEVGGTGSVVVSRMSLGGRSGPQMDLSALSWVFPGTLAGPSLRLFQMSFALFVPISVWTRVIWLKSSHEP